MGLHEKDDEASLERFLIKQAQAAADPLAIAVDQYTSGVLRAVAHALETQDKDNSLEAELDRLKFELKGHLGV